MVFTTDMLSESKEPPADHAEASRQNSVNFAVPEAHRHVIVFISDTIPIRRCVNLQQFGTYMPM